MSPAALQRALEGKALKAIRRHGKQLFLDFGGSDLLWVHLGMTGKWVQLDSSEPRRWVRVILQLRSGHRVAFVDQRRFGSVASESGMNQRKMVQP